MAAPILYFTDIITGANTGGEGGNGVYLTIYGKNFGATQGASTVSVAGGAPAQYKIWGSGNSITGLLDMIVVQIGAASGSTDSVTVTVGGLTSNALSFTVCTGNIYFVSPSGSDSNVGSFASPWLTPHKARTSMHGGDTVYFRAGTYTTVDDFGAPLLLIGNSGTAGAYQNFLGYPGETAQIGDSSVGRAIYFWGNTVLQYVTIGQLKVRSNASSISIQNTTGGAAANYIREVGNDVSTSGSGEGIDFEMPCDHIVIYGNESGNNCPTCNFDNRAYSIYFGGYGAQSNIDIGWNRLHDNLFGKGLQVYGHQIGDTMTNMLFHDNSVYNNTMPGITAGGGDPAGGDITVSNFRVYNNLFWNCAYGSGHGAQGMIQLQSYTNANGDYHFYNNTFFDDGVNHGNSLPITIFEIDNLGVSSAEFHNNVFYAASSMTSFYSSTTGFSGGNNIYFGIPSSHVPAFDTTSIYGDPKLVNVATMNLHLSSTSPAIGAGTHSFTTTLDYDGLTRPNPPSIGAYEFASGSNPVIGVNILPMVVFLAKGAQQQFTATVTGTPNTTVIWSANAPGGLFTATSPGVFAVTATSLADLTKSATAMVTVKGVGMPSTVTVDFVVAPAAPVILPVSLPPLEVGQAFSYAFQATGCAGPSCVWSVVSGSLPAGLGLTPDGVVSGTPTVAGSSTVTFQVV